MNKAILIGRLTRDPELRTTQSGIPVCAFTLAVDRKFTGKDGKRETDFLKVVAWRQTGEFIHRFFKQGEKIALTGSIQSRTYADKDGANVTVVEIIADEAEFVERKQGGGQQKASSPPKRQQSATQVSMDDDDDDLPF